MADDVARVAQRCDDAKENQQLNLSCCRLKKMPDAIYFILRDIHVESCNLDDNLLRILPGKFCNNFKGLRDLILSGNKLTRLPDQMAEMVDLVRLDISRNQFAELPPVVIQLPSISTIFVRENAITAVDIEQVKTMKELKELDLRGNPLMLPTRQSLATVESIHIYVDQPVDKPAGGDPYNRLDELD